VREAAVVSTGDEAGNRFRLERQAKVLKSFAGEESDLPSPPYHLHGVSMIYVLCRFDPEAARRIVHPELQLCDPCLGLIGIFSTEAAWGLGGYSACIYGLQVQGHDSPDGYPANFVHCGFVTGRAVQAYKTHFNRRMRPGFVTLRREGDQYFAEAGEAEGRPAIRVRARHTDQVGPELTGINYYVGDMPGGATLFSVGYNARYRDIDDVHIEITDDAPETIAALKPLEVIWPMRIDGMSMTYSPPRSISEPTPMVPQDTLRASVFELLSAMGRPAAIVTQSGRIAYSNSLAQNLVSGDNRRALASPTWARRSVELLNDEAVGAESNARLRPIPIDLPDGRRVFVQLLPMHAGVTDEPSVLMLLTDPETAGGRDPTNLLLMLGLTAAEARVAARVGRGMSPGDAAVELGISVNTAREALQVVFEKLGIRRQAQLAQVVTRLEFV
jgi:DNA-binding CsgD family transcriptional regulator